MEKLIIATGIIITLIGFFLHFRASKKEILSNSPQETHQTPPVITDEKIDTLSEAVTTETNSWEEEENSQEQITNEASWGEEEENNQEQFDISEETNFKTVYQETPTNDEIESLIQMAVADGIVTSNEKKIILQKAQELGKDISEVEQELAEALAQTDVEAETKLIDKNKEKGDLFEAYVVSKFNKKYFILTEWAGDKYSKGNYAETTTQPDLKLGFAYKGVEQDFAVECKYRSKYYKDKVIWAKKHQIENYKKFQDEQGVPVFIALGIGGTADNPEEMFIIPLNAAQYPTLKKGYLLKFKKKNHHEKKLFFDAEKLKLF